jgi:hypothetical protein
MLSLAALAASTVLALLQLLGLLQPPYLGIACPGPNTTTCGRVGIAVWLHGPARRVDASLAGVTVRLHDDGLAGQYRTGYATLPPGPLGLPLRWYGTKPPKWLLLRGTIRRADGTTGGAVRSFLHAGLG